MKLSIEGNKALMLGVLKILPRLPLQKMPLYIIQTTSIFRQIQTKY